MIRYLHIDCEMGGRELKYSLLTAYFMVTDDKFQILGALYLELKPDDGTYILSGQGMGVNGINLQAHDTIAVPYKEARAVLYKFLQTHTGTVPLIGNMLLHQRLTPVGHGVRGDIEHIIDKLISAGSWEKFCTHHYIDTSVVLQFLRACGKMPHDADGSVSALAKHFDIKVNGELHDARVDTQLTCAILKKFVELGTDK